MRLVDRSHPPAKRPLDQLGIARISIVGMTATSTVPR
jgi:hypothetical protein